MKGYRTPSWFRTKVHLKEKQIKARTAQPKTDKSKTGKQGFVKPQSSKPHNGG